MGIQASRVRDTLVAVDEWVVVLNQREAQRRGLLDHRGVQIDATERGLGLSDGGVKRARVADTQRAAANLKDAAVQLDDLPQGEISRITRAGDTAPRSSAGRAQRRA
jgi:hypothetical protein